MIEKFKKKNSDKKDWEEFINDPQDIFDKDKLENKNHISDKKYKFDFHGYSIENANKKLEEVVLKCFNENISEILIITGKGLHSDEIDNVYTSKEYKKLQNTLPDFLKNNSDLNSKIISIKQAPKKLGGNGALVIKLKKIKE